MHQFSSMIVVPAPAFTEFLVGAKSARDSYQSRTEQTRRFIVAPYDKKASIECAILLGNAFSTKERKAITKTRFKFDWMIVAIAKSTPGLECIYCGDGDVMRYAPQAGIAARHIDSVPLPTQMDWVNEMPTSSTGADAA